MNQTRIIIVGDSILSFLIAWLFDQELAREVETEIIWLTSGKEQIHWPRIDTLLGRKEMLSKSRLIQQVRVSQLKIVSANLRNNHLVCEKRIIPYQYLIVDQTPSYSSDELAVVEKEASRLFAYLQAAKNIGHERNAKVRILGANACSYQLALAFSQDYRMFGKNLPKLSFYIQSPAVTKLNQFLSERGILNQSNQNDDIGFLIKEPHALLPNKKIRGLVIDRENRAVVNQYLTLDQYPEVTLLDHHNSGFRSIIKDELQLAKAVVKNVERRMLGKPPKSISFTKPAMIIQDQDGVFLWEGNNQTTGLKAHSVARLDLAAFRRFGSRS